MTTNNLYLFIFIGLVILIVLVYIISNLSKQDEAWKTKILSELKKASKGLNSDNDMLLKQILIQTDKILDHALKGAGARGNTLGERLKMGRKYFSKSTYNDVWEAHKLRNRVVHEMNYNVSNNQLKSAYFKLKKGIEEIIKN